jgi:hypothetical protein
MRRNLDRCNLWSSELLLSYRKLAAFTIAMSGEQPEHGRSRRNFYPGTGVPILAAKRYQTSLFANRRR